MKKEPRYRDPLRIKARNAETKRVQTALYADFKDKVEIMHDIEDQKEVIRSIVPQMDRLEYLFTTPHKVGVNMVNDATWRDLDIKAYHLPIDEVVDKIAGPIHRHYDVDWKMEVKGPDHINLSTQIPGTTREYARITVNIHVFSGFPTCNVVLVEGAPLVIDQKSYKVVCS